ncbi:MAG: alkaline phosphatase [Tissierellia bacterium]|nr:alkaline phosphatase [Tissierellia bacterium]
MFKFNKRIALGLLAVMTVVSAVFSPMEQLLVKNAHPTAQVEAAGSNTSATIPAKKAPKYLFLFIGDGMAHVQVQAAQVYKGNNKYGEVKPELINFSKFPVTGVATTHDSTSFAPDSASTATSLSSGTKTHSGVIGLTTDKKTSVETIAEKAKQADMKVGIISSVTLNHATPAAFWANVESRGQYYDIGLQMAQTDFDYFAGGSLGQRTGKEKDKKDLYEILKESGYKVTETRADFEEIKAGDKVYAVSERLQDSGSMPYTIDQVDSDITLADYVKKGIEVLDNEKGFFMMVESGKIDWACHANDAGTVIHEVIGYEEAIAEAIAFYEKHPEDTLILVTGDHETGGLTIGHATMGYDTAFDMIEKQKMSYVDFDTKFEEMKKSNPELKLSTVLAEIEETFGLKVKPDVAEGEEIEDPFVLTKYEYEMLKNAFEESMKPEDNRAETQETGLLYGGYNPISVTLTHILNNKAGIGWTSYAHTGVPVAVYALGATAENYGGYYDNTDIFFKMMDSLKLK